MKKEILLSSLFLMSGVSGMTAETFAQFDKKLDRIEKSQRRFASYLSNKIGIEHVAENLQIELNINLSNDLGNSILNKMEMYGYMHLLKDGEYQTSIGGGDGNIVFNLTDEDETSKTYSGFTCSSTWKNCEFTGLIQLTLNKKSNTYTLNLEHEVELQISGNYTQTKIQTSNIVLELKK